MRIKRSWRMWLWWLVTVLFFPGNDKSRKFIFCEKAFCSSFEIMIVWHFACLKNPYQLKASVGALEMGVSFSIFDKDDVSTVYSLIFKTIEFHLQPTCSSFILGMKKAAKEEGQMTGGPEHTF